MRIQAKLVIGSVTVDLDAEVPPGERTVTVTNAPPQCLIIPRERFPLAALSFTPLVLAELSARNLASIFDLVGRAGWEIKVKGLSAAAEAELQERLQALEQASLLPDLEGSALEEIAARPEPVPFPIAEEAEDLGLAETETTATAAPSALKKAVADDAPLTGFYLTEHILKALRLRKIATVGQLAALTKAALIMTPSLTSDDIRYIEKRLAGVGRQLTIRGLGKTVAPKTGGGNGARPAKPEPAEKQDTLAVKEEKAQEPDPAAVP